LRKTSKKTKPAATRAEAYALAAKLKELGEAHLGAAALICFEWLQRPENVLDGKITWADYRPTDRPLHVRVIHQKTGESVWMPLEDRSGTLYPELENYLAELPRLGLPIVLTTGNRGPARPYSNVYAQRRVGEARAAAELGQHVTLDACRHGGMTELGDAELTEQGVMTLSGHKTPQTARLYVKRTELQRECSARKRRQWVEANETGSKVRIERQSTSQNGTKDSS
jgi:integrase